MSTHEWDMREALGAEGRAVDLFQTLEREVNRLRDKVNRLELELLVCNDLLDSVAAERDQAVDRCLAMYGRGKVTLHGMSGEWLPGAGATELDDDIAGLA